MPEWVSVIIGVAIVPIVGWLTASFVSDETLYNFFKNLGSKVDAGASKYIGDQNWEAIEDTLLQKFVVCAQGLKDGADADDVI